MQDKRHSRLQSTGSVVVLVLLAMAILVAVGVALLQTGFQARLRSIRACSDIRAKSAADAAMAEALAQINQLCSQDSLDDSALPQQDGIQLEHCDATFSYRLTKNADGDYVIQAAGFSGPVRKNVSAVLRKTGGPFNHAILSKHAVNIAPGMTCVAYDSQDPTATGLKVQMGTLSTDATATVVTKPGSHVEGDLFCGVGGDPAATICVGGTQNGENYALTEKPEILQPEMPGSLLFKGTDLKTNGSTVTLTPADSGVYDNFVVNKGAGKPGTFVVDGGVVTLGVTNFMKFDTNCQIIVNEGSTLIMYIACGISAMNGSGIAYEGSALDPTHIQLYGTGTGEPQMWALKAKSTWTGVVYAPNADVCLAAGRDVYGAIMANSTILDVQPGFAFHYDVNLQRANNTALGGSGDFEVKRWSE
jgi:hypothetical protein